MKVYSGLILASVSLGAVSISPAAIVFDNPSGDTTQPNNSILWNSVGNWDSGGGVVISSNSFISAQHLDFGFNNGTFTLDTTVNNVTTFTPYQTISHELIPNTDLVVWQINGTFPTTSIVPLYSGSVGSEIGQQVSMVSFGYHTQGTPIVTSAVNNGWYWAGTRAKNMGQNTISGVTNDGPGNSNMIDFLFAGGTDSIWAADDSGGGAFIFNNGEYQLAGIAYGITEYFSKNPTTGAYTALSDGNGGGGYDAAIYDGTGLYVTDGMGNYYAADTVGAMNQEGDASEIADYLSLIEADASVPEPASITLIAAGGLLLLNRRRRSLA